MSNYNYYRQYDRLLLNRFNTIEGFGEGYRVLGLAEWRRYVGMLGEYRERILEEIPAAYAETPRTPEAWILLILRQRLRALRPLAPANPCPRLFISHRRSDKNYALRVASLASQSHFAWWVDVLDPHLNALPLIPPPLQPLLTACIIEMALLNCTHVIALMTPNSPGSAWIPYEYGRVKDTAVVSINAAAWLHPGLGRRKLPDYMLLGETTTSETQIRQWLDREYRVSGAGSIPCIPRVEKDKDVDEAAELPQYVRNRAGFDVHTRRRVILMKRLILKK